MPPPWPCSRTSTVKPTPFEQALALTKLDSNTQKTIVYRYVPLLKTLRRRAYFLSAAFHGARTIITVGSLIVPALLSIQYTDGVIGTNSGDSSTQSMRIYWITWFISLLVTISNGLLTLFKLDKRYYFLHTTLEQLISEGWQYIQLTGRYSGFYLETNVKPTHENQYIYFCHAVEKIRMRQVEEEYYKLSEMQATAGGGQGVGTTAGRQGPESATAAAATAAPASPSAPPTNKIVNSFLPPTPHPFKGGTITIPAEILQYLQTQVSNPSTEDAGSAGPLPDASGDGKIQRQQSSQGGGHAPSEQPQGGEDRSGPQVSVQ